MTAVRPRRSALYLPASNARALEKARTLPCDVVILDLEDSVAPEDKATARDAAIAAVKAGGFGPREVVIRTNALDTSWGADDLKAVGRVGADAVLVPKIAAARDLSAARGAMASDTPLWAMIETCAAMFAIDEIGRACAANRTQVWVIGANDLVKEMRCRAVADRGPLLTALSISVMAARAHGLSILDGVYNDIPDLAGLERECGQGLDLGFDGKTLIHPSHIAVANRAFTPDPEAVAWARTVCDAFAMSENVGKGVIKVDGRMVERLHLEQAQRLIAVADAIAAHEV